MIKQSITLQEVDEVKITILMDNITDLFIADSEVAQRFNLSNLSSAGLILPLAEHGFSALISVRKGDKEGTVLFDAGISSNGVLHNMDCLGLKLNTLDAIVISHGHIDHTRGLLSLIEHLGSQKYSIVVHPDTCLERKMVMPNGYEVDISGPGINDIQRDNITLIEKRDPTLIAGDMVLVSGEIERTTDFEAGFPIHYSKRNGAWEKDPLVKDDQCLIVNVHGQGLVIITGCGHSGIINTIRYAQALTNNNKVLAVLGGFHLTGPIFEKNIPPTIAELKKIKPRYIMPGHCTGWSAIQQIERALPDAFIPNNVCTTLTFKR